MTMTSSPASASVTNSWLALPPIGPASASHATYGTPQRSKILWYASYIASYVRSSDAALGVEAVGILHQKLAHAQQAKARAFFVAVFRLDLVEDERKLPV
jgi:hypothetical protein